MHIKKSDLYYLTDIRLHFLLERFVILGHLVYFSLHSTLRDFFVRFQFLTQIILCYSILTLSSLLYRYPTFGVRSPSVFINCGRIRDEENCPQLFTSRYM